MQLIVSIILALLALTAQHADAQALVSGTVLDAETMDPVIGATVADAIHSKVLTVTQADGTFTIPKNGDAKLRKFFFAETLKFFLFHNSN